MTQELIPYRARWHQEGSADVDYWEFEASQGFEWIPVEPPLIGPCSTCFEALLSLPDQSTMLRSRAFNYDGEPSEWSKVLPLGLPEPDGLDGLGIGLIFLLFLQRIKRGSSRSRMFGKRPSRSNHAR